MSLRMRAERRVERLEGAEAKLPGKASKDRFEKSVPETDTGGRVENTKALERTRVKELGKIVP